MFLISLLGEKFSHAKTGRGLGVLSHQKRVFFLFGRHLGGKLFTLKVFQQLNFFLSNGGKASKIKTKEEEEEEDRKKEMSK